MTGGFSVSTNLHSPGPIGDVTPGTVGVTQLTFPGSGQISTFGSVIIGSGTQGFSVTLAAALSADVVASTGELRLGGVNYTVPNARLKATSANGFLVRNAADDGAGSIAGKLTTDTAATTGLAAGVLAATTNSTITLYDSSGQAYRVPCII